MHVLRHDITAAGLRRRAVRSRLGMNGAHGANRVTLDFAIEPCGNTVDSDLLYWGDYNGLTSLGNGEYM